MGDLGYGHHEKKEGEIKESRIAMGGFGLGEEFWDLGTQDLGMKMIMRWEVD